MRAERKGGPRSRPERVWRGSYSAAALPPADRAPDDSSGGAGAAQQIHDMKQVTRTGFGPNI